MYERGLAALAAGRDREALPLLIWVASQREHAAAPYAVEMLRWMKARASVTKAAPLPSQSATPLQRLGARLRDETPSDRGRVILTVGQFVNGVGFGAALCAFASCPSPGYGVGMMALGGAGALTVSAALTPQGITTGHALALSVGPAIGIANAALISSALNLRPRTEAAAFAFSQVAGTGLAELVWEVLRPSAGDVSLATSFAGWSIGFAALGHAAVHRALYAGNLPASLLVGMDAGLIVGSVVAWVYPVSVARMSLINVGFLIGLGVGAGVGTLVNAALISVGADIEMNSSGANTVLFGSVGAGAVLGAAVATILSRNWDFDHLPPVTPVVLPTSTGGVTPGLAFRF